MRNTRFYVEDSSGFSKEGDDDGVGGFVFADPVDVSHGGFDSLSTLVQATMTRVCDDLPSLAPGPSKKLAIREAVQLASCASRNTHPIPWLAPGLLQGRTPEHN